MGTRAEPCEKTGFIRRTRSLTTSPSGTDTKMWKRSDKSRPRMIAAPCSRLTWQQLSRTRNPNIALQHLVPVLDRTDDVGAMIQNTVAIEAIIQRSHKSVVLAPLAKCRTPCHHIYLPIPKGQIHEERRQNRNKCQNNFSASPSSSDETAQSGIAARYGLGAIGAC